MAQASEVARRTIPAMAVCPNFFEPVTGVAFHQTMNQAGRTTHAASIFVVKPKPRKAREAASSMTDPERHDFSR